MPGWRSACFRSFTRDGDNPYSKSNGVGSSGSEENHLSNINEDRKGISFVELVKKEGLTLGLIISGGIDKGSKPKISNLRPGSIAHRCDALAVGDNILSVNGIRTAKLKHEEIVNLLKNAGDKVTLEVEYEIPLLSTEESLSVCSKVIQVKLDKENESFGFTLRGGTNGDRLKSSSLVITHVRFGGPADRDGIIKAGDRLLAIDGINLSIASLQEVLMLLKQINQSALFTIEYDVSVIDAVKNATGPLLVEIEKTSGNQLGINLTRISVPEHAIVIESIRQASVAERCGALHVGDHVIAIDEVRVELMTSAEAMQLIKSSSRETVKLEILPVSQLALRRVPETNVKRARATFSNSCYSTLSSLGGLSVSCNAPFAAATPPFASRSNRNGATVCTGYNCPSVPSSSDANSGFTAVGYVDRTEVSILADHKGFGFALQGSPFSLDILTTPPFISSIESNCPAEKSGVLQIGDRVLAINDENTEGLSMEEVTQLVNRSHSHVTLITEFDVAEAVVPSSGTFVVKLAKGGADLGITVTAAKNRQIGEPLIIAHIKKGSVAHRTGSIQPGDKLLAINSIRTENCTVDDASAILQNSSDIVKLRIRKDETFADDPDESCAIVYTVELVRHGGPLGITVSGREEPFHPIVISGLTPNGLAERTGALHVNDKILAINGNSLRGKTLSEAICILQMCGDTVTLKISKCTCIEKFKDEVMQDKCIHCGPENRLKSSITPLPSVDSAVDSWDSCNLETSINCSKIKSKTNGVLSSHDNLQGMFDSTCVPSTSHRSVIHNNEQDAWGRKTPSSNSFSESHSLPSDEEKESWHKVLEDLQTCGQSQLLRQIERTILGVDENENVGDVCSSSPVSLENGSKYHSDTLSEKNLQELNCQIAQLNSNCKTDLKQDICENLFSSPDEFSSHNHDYTNRHSICYQPGNYHYQPSSLVPLSLPIEIHKVTLFKDQVYEDFGFSLSDGKYENGVYINSIRSGGPADISGVIKPLDRILQVNNVKTYNAGLIVPLIASSGDRIELVISRPAYDNGSSSESTLGRTSNYLPWVDENEREGSLSPFISHSQTVTKTL